jgi:hypothetical protein
MYGRGLLWQGFVDWCLHKMMLAKHMAYTETEVDDKNIN